MSTRGTVVADVEARPRVPWGSRICAWLLLAGCGVLLVTMLVVGERTTSYDELRGAVRSGDVHEVTVGGESPGALHGYRTVEVSWRDGILRRVAHVVEASPRAARGGGEWEQGVPVITTDVADDLAGIRPGVEVHREHLTMIRSGDVLGWRLPEWAGPAAFLIGIATFLLLVGGPDPWRANRWAWFWFLLLASPVGLVAFLVLGGSTGLLRPADPSRRMRGGWGFLLALVVGAASSAVARSVGL